MAKKRRLQNEINVVPYIDVMLVLLVIFMVTAPMMNTASIDLPSVAQSPQVSSVPLEIVIHEDSSLGLIDRDNNQQEERLNEADLIMRIKTAQSGTPRAVVIAGDKNVKYQVILSVMEKLQNAQIQKVGLLVKSAGG